MPMEQNTRRQALIFAVATGTIALLSGWLRAEAATKAVVHKSPTCGCCGAWTARLRDAGYVVEEIVEADMQAVKKRLGVPERLASCHTAEIDGYVVEGHVPPQAVARLLQERPKAIGLAAPGMPAGSPGMEGGEPEVYRIYLFDDSGARPFGDWRGDKPA
ncbi:MAG: DUF411 domain-containing protein [Methylocystis sp.]|uniref:DUF411 domain-containing protein n=1 Tax=Methylocystis sp. TaxID=1911079 RepID=UPI0039494A64